MIKQLLSFSLLSLAFSFLLHCVITSAQSPTEAPALVVTTPPLAAANPPSAAANSPSLLIADSPVPSGPTNVTKILEKAGQFSVLIRLLKNTEEGKRLMTLLNDSSQGITLFAPTDRAFSKLKSGTLNSLTDQEKVQLIQFHVLPTYLSLSNFQTLSNPVETDIGDIYEFPLNISTLGNSVNISTGLVQTSVSGTIYTDNQLAIYQIDDVLKPLGIFKPRPPLPAPAPEKSKKKANAIAESPNSVVKDDSGAFVVITGKKMLVCIGFGVIASLIL